MAKERRHKNDAIIISTIKGERGPIGFTTEGSTGIDGLKGLKGNRGSDHYNKLDLAFFNNNQFGIRTANVSFSGVDLCEFIFPGTNFIGGSPSKINILAKGVNITTNIMLMNSGENYTIGSINPLIVDPVYRIYEIPISIPFVGPEQTLKIKVINRKTNPSISASEFWLGYLEIY
jgi:hypothetical protein